MESLREILIAAVEQPPPSGIDIDRLITGELRARGRRRASFVAAGGAAAVLLIAGGGIFLRPTTGNRLPAEPVLCGSERPKPTTSQEPTFDGIPNNGVAAPTEGASDAVLRLSAALTNAFAKNLPGRTVSDHIHVGCHWVQVEPNIYPARYYGWADVAGSTSGSIVVMISEKGLPALRAPGSPYGDLRTLPDGTIVGLVADGTSQVGAFRPDGTSLMVLVPNGQPATVDELIALIADPRLTLYP
jgi:hypothetical protein